jgi:hypothetical protein
MPKNLLTTGMLVSYSKRHLFSIGPTFRFSRRCKRSAASGCSSKPLRGRLQSPLSIAGAVVLGEVAIWQAAPGPQGSSPGVA